VAALVVKRPVTARIDWLTVDTVTILRRLWRFRIPVALIALVAIVAGVFVSYEIPSMQSRKYTVGVGSARILVDTPASQVVDLSPEGSDSVGARAALLSSLMVDGEIKDAIARQAGLQPDQLVAINQNSGLPDAAEGPQPRDSFVMSPEVTMISSSNWLPIIQISTQAPKRAEAEKLANAAVQGLTRYLDSKAAKQAIPGAKRLRVSGLGAAEGHDETRGPSMALSFVAALALFAIGCALLLGISDLVRALRAGPVPETDPVDVHPVRPHVNLTPEPAARRSRANAAQLYQLDEQRKQRQPDEPERVIKEAETAVASAATVPPPAHDAAGWWGGGPS
jgi:hypothetical protein